MRTKNYPGHRSKSEIGQKCPDFGSPMEIVGATDVTLSPGGISDSEKWKLGGCPRCSGDVFLDTEEGELLGHCLQCGYVGTRAITQTANPSLDD